jgi:hypothetical protein
LNSTQQFHIEKDSRNANLYSKVGDQGRLKELARLASDQTLSVAERQDAGAEYAAFLKTITPAAETLKTVSLTPYPLPP